MEEKREAREIKEQSKLLLWLENYWYHYKWHTILGAFFLMVIIVSTVQCASVEKTDVTVAFCGNAALSQAQMDGLSEVLGDVCPTDVDGNGEKAVSLGQFSIFSEEQLTALYTYVDPNDGQTKVDKTGFNAAKGDNLERIQTLQNYIMTGDCAVWLVSEYVYSGYFDEKIGVVEKVALKDTAIYRQYDAVKDLPDGMMLILTHPVMGFYAEDAHFAEAQAYYNAAVHG